MPWKPAALSDLERENHALQMAVLKLRRELTNKQQYAGRLEVLLHERMERIDEFERHDRPAPAAEPAAARWRDAGSEVGCCRKENADGRFGSKGEGYS